jgi:hypothetical protein
VEINWDVAVDTHNKKMGIGVIVEEYYGEGVAYFAISKM